MVVILIQSKQSEVKKFTILKNVLEPTWFSILINGLDQKYLMSRLANVPLSIRY